jgi:RNA polymerase sigma-70 factor (ECF subfamily)
MNPTAITNFHSFSDEDVMTYFQGGYEEAFAEIVNRYRDRIHHYIYRYTRNHLDCEDIVQETFFRVYRSRHSYERIARLSTWLYTIAGNLMRSHYKKNSRLQTTPIHDLASDYSEMELDIVDTRLTPDIELEESYLVDIVYKALDRLPNDFREIIVMRDIQNLSYEEIEEITGLPMGTVKSRINRARARIQALIVASTKSETLFFD